ncbi:hypothetical protein BDQ12DRAFT_672783 [Crucibulum laeve]|uniref:Uncharacterized protein n=1 Tax=Crucibulum laeve TaxID=68775 RepID=A0A5C3MI31_9AGAR|nr:hypothetical protein BDQ12DRAFT_672783 [Crucibulum laeve]
MTRGLFCLLMLRLCVSPGIKRDMVFVFEHRRLKISTRRTGFNAYGNTLSTLERVEGHSGKEFNRQYEPIPKIELSQKNVAARISLSSPFYALGLPHQESYGRISRNYLSGEIDVDELQVGVIKTC